MSGLHDFHAPIEPPTQRSVPVRGVPAWSVLDQTDRRTVLALFVLGMLSAIVCVTSTGVLQWLTAVVALATPLMGRTLLANPVRCVADPGVADGR